MPTEHPLGATVRAAGVEFRVWAPTQRRVFVDFVDDTAGLLELNRDAAGYFAGVSINARAGARYRYRLDSGDSHPDPYSRFQPEGPHGPSMVIDPGTYQWNDATWPGLDPFRQVIYELHIGTFTADGTYAAATAQLGDLKDLGITAIEIMPVNEFQGRFGWGYDGVNWYAPFHHYGAPDALRRFVDQAHQAGLGVILDVVYNHFGHDGNYLPCFSTDYVTEKFKNPWGGTPNYACEAMRRLVIDNAGYWMREFHFDGLRLDATHSIHDPQHPSLLAALVREARAAAQPRTIVISAEDFLQRTPLLGTSGADGASIDQLWNDDFHHACRVALTGNHFGFFKSYRGTAQEILSSLLRGFLFQGQHDPLNHGPRGFGVLDEPRTSFVAFTQNHDAVANTLQGQRLQPLVSPGRFRALTAALLLGPLTPLIFMGQEFNASAPFAYFADYPEVAGTSSLWQSRRREAQEFEQYRDPDAISRILDPCAETTFAASKLDFAERAANGPTLRLFADLLSLRDADPVLKRRPAARVEGAVLNEHAFVLRWFDSAAGDRLLIVNLGRQLEPRPWAEPLLAPPSGRSWHRIWASESPYYGGMGVVDPVHADGWQCAADCAVFLVAQATGGVTA